MQYLITFLEGFISFISPCLLPMLPIYFSFLAGSMKEEDSHHRLIKNSAFFVLGFTTVFLCLGLFAGTLGGLLRKYQTGLNLVCGIFILILGLNYMGGLKLPGFSGMRPQTQEKEHTAWSSRLFGVVFSVSWTPCIGAFLGSALLLASQQGSTAKGLLLLLAYSVGLGLPFLISAFLLDSLQGAFAAVKRHYRIIHLVSGIFLILIGILMMTWLLGRFLTLLS